MKFNFISVVVFLFSIIFHVNAQNTLDNLGLTNATNPSAAYSFRLLSSTYTGPLARITVGSSFYDVYPDNTTKKNFSLNSPISSAYANYNDVSTGATSNLLSSIISSSTSATVAIWYDQTGNNKNALQATTGSQPRIINAGTIDNNLGFPAMTFQNYSQLMVYPNADLTVQTINGVRSSPNQNWQTFVALGANQDFSVRGYDNSLYNISSSNGNDWANGTSPNNTWVNRTQIVSYSSTNNHTVVTSSQNPVTNSMSISTTFYSTRGMHGGASVSEIVLFPSTLSETERTTVENNQIDHYLLLLIETHPSTTNQSVALGGTPTNLTVTSGVTGATFQWYSNTANSNSGGTLLPGEVNSTYTPNTSAEGTLYYYVIVSASTKSATSNVSGHVRVGIEITSQPSTSSQIVYQGNAVTPLTVQATGTNLSYQWYSNTANSTSGGTLLSGANNSSYTPSSANIGTLYYYVTVSGTNTVLTSSVSGSVITKINLPNISYNTGAQNYVVNSAITPLVITNTGGAITSTATVSTIAGSGSPGNTNGNGTAARFRYPTGITIDANGNLYVADQENNTIRKITSSGDVTTIAGSGSPGNTNGNGTAARFFYPTGITIDANGNLYVAERENHTIRKITSSGDVTTIAGSIIRGNTDGNGTAARFFRPAGITIDANGNLYVADQYNHTIRKITSSGDVTTIAGSIFRGNTDGNGTAARFYWPTGITIDANGNLYVAERGNHTIRKITSSGDVTTIAGSIIRGNTDGNGTAASFYEPHGITIDANGNLYVADQRNNIIRKITSSGNVTTIAGSGSRGSTDGDATAAGFYYPFGITTDASGNLYVADQFNHTIRKITIAPFQISPQLPNGLSFNGLTGEISGTPTIATPSTTYTVTGYNSSGSSSTTISIRTSLLPTISNFSNVIKTYFDGNYTITPPTSNSSGAFTYTSSNTNAATINGTVVTLVGAGTTSITAAQAADATYFSGSISATLTVNSVSVITKYGEITGTNVNYVNKYGVVSADEGVNSNGRNILAKTILSVGESYGGGIVGYILQSGDPGYDPRVQHGLIVSSSNQSSSAAWACDNMPLVGAAGTTIGTGSQNTTDILSSCAAAGCPTSGIAAKLCDDLVEGGYSDWYLPSSDELSKLYLNKNTITGFSQNFYWSSSKHVYPSDPDKYAKYVNFNNGAGEVGYNSKTSTYSVRAIRSF